MPLSRRWIPEMQGPLVTPHLYPSIEHVGVFRNCICSITTPTHCMPRREVSDRAQRRLTLWQVGFPRRKSSLSIAGRSSWISDMVWIISIATALGIACSTVPPTSSHAARHSTGRTLLPPASSECLRRELDVRDATSSTAENVPEM